MTILTLIALIIFGIGAGALFKDITDREMIATTIEQSKRLLEAGIDSQTADMYYTMYRNGTKPENGDADLNFTFEAEDGRWYFLEIYENFDDTEHFEGIHAWSLSALILLLPEHAFNRIARARGKDVDGIFEDCVTYLCNTMKIEKIWKD